MDDRAVEQVIWQYLPQVIHMSVATAVDNKPYACELHYAYDDELNLYWVSEKSARHSENVHANPLVSGTIVVQHFNDQMPRGVAFEGKAEVLEGLTAEDLPFKTYLQRFPSRAPFVEKGYQSDEPNARRIYKVTVTDFYLIDGITTGRLEKHHLAWK